MTIHGQYTGHKKRANVHKHAACQVTQYFKKNLFRRKTYSIFANGRVHLKRPDYEPQS